MLLLLYFFSLLVLSAIIAAMGLLVTAHGPARLSGLLWGLFVILPALVVLSFVVDSDLYGWIAAATVLILLGGFVAWRGFRTTRIRTNAVALVSIVVGIGALVFLTIVFRTVIAIVVAQFVPMGFLL